MSEIRVPIQSDADAVVARQHGRSAALRLGMSRSDATFVATAISEIARNITVHAGSGEIVIREVRDRHRAELVVIARDEGPGIADAESVLQAEHNSDVGLGMGLWGARRLMDEVVVESELGHGTTVTMRKWRELDPLGIDLEGPDARVR